MNTLLLRWACLLASVAMLSCAAAPQSVKHPWYNPIPQGSEDLPETAALRESDYAEVRVTALHTAINRLEEIPFLELAPEMVKYYAPASFRVPQGKKAFLVRSLYSNETGGYSLLYWKGRLSIAHFSLGGSFHPNPLPLSVLLKSPPLELFVTYGGAR